MVYLSAKFVEKCTQSRTYNRQTFAARRTLARASLAMFVVAEGLGP